MTCKMEIMLARIEKSYWSEGEETKAMSKWAVKYKHKRRKNKYFVPSLAGEHKSRLRATTPLLPLCLQP